MRVSATFISYNQERYVEAALRSLLSQDYPLEIIVADDCSIDATPQIIQHTLAGYKGHHTIRLLAAERNLGVVGNQNAALALATGELIVMFEGDDISRTDRVSKLVETAAATGAAAISSYVNFIDARGALVGVWRHRTRGDFRTCLDWGAPGCGLAFRRTVLDYGPLAPCLLSGDIAIWLRAAFSGGMAVVPEPLVDYRRHPDSVTAKPLFDYSSPEVLRECCRRLVPNQWAQVRECELLRSNLRREAMPWWTAVHRQAIARAKLIETIATRPRPLWIWPAIKGLVHPSLRSLAIRAAALAVAPALGRFSAGRRG